MSAQNRILLERARALRRNMTDAERKLWYQFLRAYPVKFTRQHLEAPYILDFFCYQAMLAVELDGSQHYEKQGQEADVHRTSFLQKKGIAVVRYSNLDVLQNFSGVCSQIDRAVWQRIKKEK